MTRRRVVTFLVLLAAAAAAVLLLTRVFGSKAGEEEEVVTDVAVHVGAVGRATLRRYVTAYGTVESERPGDGRAASGADVSAPVGGILAEIKAVEGRRVEKGALLFRLDTRLAEVAVAKAAKALDFAERTYERQKGLLASDATSAKTFQEAELALESARNDLAAAKTELSLLEIKAPLAGTVVRVNARLGQTVETNQVLAEVIDLDRLVVAARVPSREAGLLKPGEPVDLGAGAPAGAKVVLVGKDIDPKTDTVLVRAALPPGSGLQPGEFRSIRIVSEERAGVLAVPEDAVVTGPDGGTVLWLVEGDRAVPKPVTTGLRDAGQVEVRGEGLKEGTVIVTTDAYNLTGETKIHIVKDKE